MALPQDIQAITPEQIGKAYTGKPGCMCGCKGTYYYRASYRAAGGESRGYVVNDCEIGDVEVTLILRTLQATPWAKLEDGILYAETGSLSLAAYLLPAVL